MLLLTSVQQAVLSIRPVDVRGNPAPVEGVPEWSVSNPTVLDVVPSADGMSAIVLAQGPVGSAQVNVTADADLGAGIATISGVLDVQVVAAQAVALQIQAEAPTNQP